MRPPRVPQSPTLFAAVKYKRVRCDDEESNAVYCHSTLCYAHRGIAVERGKQKKTNELFNLSTRQPHRRIKFNYLKLLRQSKGREIKESGTGIAVDGTKGAQITTSESNEKVHGDVCKQSKWDAGHGMKPVTGRWTDGDRQCSPGRELIGRDWEGIRRR
ncbi:hypothetical protein F2P81_015679 [Scophthalmus maximus]|uniref:Uncharacterized protein n=1 Tax=Scophthalmus maximus TaxID=52904 RepID=A0A6A4SJH0_SCOMX|nr:hypothetical protein F2P81_015679 [Scophthalmus maximus]